MPAACWNAPTSSCRPRPAVNEAAWSAKKSIKGGHDAFLVRAYELMEDLRKVRADHNLDRRLRVYPAPKVLVVDEFGIWPCDRDSATAFLHPGIGPVRAGRHHPHVQQRLRRVGRVLDDTLIASAILDRLLHHSDVLNIRGESYRRR